MRRSPWVCFQPESLPTSENGFSEELMQSAICPEVRDLNTFPLKARVCPGAEGLLGRELMASGQPEPRALVLSVLQTLCVTVGKGSTSLDRCLLPVN